jgi:diguanylate cyclase (GGDEF)-like protein
MFTKCKNREISLRTIHVLLVAVAILLSGLMLYSTFFLSVSFKNLTRTEEKHIELRKAANELLEASDFMTEKVQRFAVSGEMSLLNDYYNEAFIVSRRDEAIKTMEEDPHSKEALECLLKAREYSQELMKTEYYAFTLVVEAKGYENIPLSLEEVTLSKEDEALSADEKINRAREIVFSNEYYAQKYLIRDNTKDCLNKLEEHINEEDSQALQKMRNRMILLRIAILIETLGLFFLVWLASRLGIRPIIRAADRIKNNSEIPEQGTSEFRYLVRAYNKMYEMYKRSIDQLNFKASHDELTGVYNRSGYESIVSTIELENTYMLLFDVDNFKSINDTFGHETGDKALIKLARVLKNNFRPDDFICRIGGDEFVVFMLHSSKDKKDLIAEKIEKINRELNDGSDGLPSISISVGIVHGSESDELDELFEKTDIAMYQSKQKGKSTYTFYTPEILSENRG